MTDDESLSSKLLDQMQREVSLHLMPSGGRVFVENASVDRIDHCSIELKCWWSDPWMFSLFVTIGDEEHPKIDRFPRIRKDGENQEETPTELGWSLGDVPIMLTLYRANDVWLDERKHHGDAPVLGQFKFYPRVNTSDGVVSDERPTITAWMALGPDNFEMVRQRTLNFEKLDFEIGITVFFPPDAEISRDVMGKRVKWNGKDTLPIKLGSVVWRKNDWSSDTDHRFHPSSMDDDDDYGEDYTPTREHVELLEAVRRIEANVIKLTTPLWLGMAGIIAAMILLR